MRENKLRLICSACAGMLLALSLLGCAAIEPPPDSGAANMASIAPEPAASTAAEPQTESASMVDERFELLSLVFRLAGREEYNDADTDYQREAASEFEGFENHEAVAYAAGLPLAYDAVFKFAVHIEKSGGSFAFIDDIASLLEDGRWTARSAEEFLPLLNAFYAETDFAGFYQSHAGFYEAETKRFIENSYSAVDLEWFGGYVDTDQLRCIYSPASSRHNYGATVNGTVVYCAVSGEGSVIVHEYCHSFANPIAHKWYGENAEFRTWCDDTVDPEKLPTYGSGQTIAGEYVTRAYNTLYYADHGGAPLPLLYAEKAQGFAYIEDVYAMITPYEKPAPGEDIIAALLGVGYAMGEEDSFSMGDREIRWKTLLLEGPLPYEYQQSEVGNIYGSSTGDVLYVEDTAESSPYLLVDLGETSFQGEGGFRMYSRLLLG